jgi:hypothetical protein
MITFAGGAAAVSVIATVPLLAATVKLWKSTLLTFTVPENVSVVVAEGTVGSEEDEPPELHPASDINKTTVTTRFITIIPVLRLSRSRVIEPGLEQLPIQLVRPPEMRS